MRSAAGIDARNSPAHLDIQIGSTRLQRSSTDLLIQYFEVYFDDAARELANLEPAPGLRHKEEAAARLREFIRGLIQLRHAGLTDGIAALASVDQLAGATPGERVLLRARMTAVLERASASPLALPTPQPAETAGSQNGVAEDAVIGEILPPNGDQPPAATDPEPTLLSPTAAAPPASALASVLMALTTKCVEVLAADLCQAFILDEDSLSLRAEAPSETPLIPGPRNLSLRSGFVARILSAAAPVMMDLESNLEGAEQIWRDRGMLCLGGVSLGDLGGPVSGVLVVARSSRHPFSATDLVALAGLAREVTQAMAGADLLARAEELAVLKERMKLAREIHDGLASDLSAVVALFKYHAHRREVDPDDADRLLVQMRELVEGSLQSARDILATLRPRAQVNRRLSEAVQRHTDEFARTYGITASVNILGEDNDKISGEERDTTYQILRESLTNVRKHSQATRLEVTLDLRERPFTLIIEDDGVGIDIAEVEGKTGSFGLLGMRERAELIGGWVDVSNGHLGGTQVMFHGPDRPFVAM